ncbi:MAG: hypothetical protein GQ564_17785 [Bacteroidales bacterium]|nr:hypothetical protein [Bacteroidales bacterium]
MNKKLLQSLLVLLALTMGFIGCEEEDDVEDLKKDTLYVKFENDSSSEFTITGIQLLLMGVAGEMDEPDGEFGENILEDDATIVPGGHTFFTLDIPNLHYAYYRLTVNDGTGFQILLCSQTDNVNCYNGPITHWGSDERTVSVTVKRDQSSGSIWVQGWSDFAGID